MTASDINPRAYWCKNCGRVWADGPASRELGTAPDGLCRECRVEDDGTVGDAEPGSAAEGRAS